MDIIISWLIYTLAVLAAAYILPGVRVSSFVTALITAAVLGILNALLRPVLIFLTLPINILTLGLFTLVINALLVYLAAKIVPGFQVDNFWWALFFGVLLAIISAILFNIIK